MQGRAHSGPVKSQLRSHRFSVPDCRDTLTRLAVQRLVFPLTPLHHALPAPITGCQWASSPASRYSPSGSGARASCRPPAGCNWLPALSEATVCNQFPSAAVPTHTLILLLVLSLGPPSLVTSPQARVTLAGKSVGRELGRCPHHHPRSRRLPPSPSLPSFSSLISARKYFGLDTRPSARGGGCCS